MIDENVEKTINELNTTAATALGYGTPGFQPAFEDALQESQRSIRSNDPLSVSAPARSFFVYTDAFGEQKYTRRGDFSVKEGVLVDGDDHAVLAAGPNEHLGTLQKLRIDPAIDVSSLRIDGAGRVSALDPKSQKRVPLGRLVLAQFAYGTRMNQDGEASSGKPAFVGFAGTEPIRRLKTSSRDLGNVSHIDAIMDFSSAESTIDAEFAANKLLQGTQRTAGDLLK